MLTVCFVFTSFALCRLYPLVFRWGLFWVVFLFLGLGRVFSAAGKGWKRLKKRKMAQFGYVSRLAVVFT